jgi:hypothetical protein
VRVRKNLLEVLGAVSGAGEEGMFEEGQCSGHKRALEKSQSHQVLETVGALSNRRIVAPT